jgi:hypothetical protein
MPVKTSRKRKAPPVTDEAHPDEQGFDAGFDAGFDPGQSGDAQGLRVHHLEDEPEVEEGPEGGLTE